MNHDNELPTLPAEASASKRTKSQEGKVLKPESAWATRIRRLLDAKQEDADYLPYMPVPKKRGLLESLRGSAKSDRSKTDE